MINSSAKIVAAHLDRLAVVYLRQSSMAQVREHAESTMRQYGLVEEAVRLGWAREAVVVIDTDLGVSRLATRRSGPGAPSSGRTMLPGYVVGDPVPAIRHLDEVFVKINGTTH